MSQVLDAVW